MSASQQRDDAADWLWDVVERSDGGHERRRRLFRRMTEQQAREWEEAYGGKLSRVDESAPRPDSMAALRRARPA
jgi:hypothetical protein